MPGLAPRTSVWACLRQALLKLAPPFNFLNVAIQQWGSSYPLSLLKRASSGVVRMLSASYMTSSIVRLARGKIFASAQLTGWPFAHACSAMADLSVRHLVQASLCSFRRVSRWRFVCRMYILPQVHSTRVGRRLRCCLEAPSTTTNMHQCP